LVELIAGTAKLVPLVAHGVLDGDPASVRPDQEQLPCVPNLPLGEEDEALLGDDGDPFREAARGREQDESA